MKLSTKGRYAITAMLDLALNASESNRVTLADISEFQGISLSYLEQLFARLRQTQLVKGTRGPGGGYRLARPATEITIAEIIAAVDENTGKEKVMKVDERHQKTQELWEVLSGHITGYLSNITIGDLVDGSHLVHNHNHSAKTDIDELGIWTKPSTKQTNPIT